MYAAKLRNKSGNTKIKLPINEEISLVMAVIQ